MDICRRCGTDNEGQTIFVLTPDTPPHYGKELCYDCGHNMRWVKKPENEGKRTKGSKFGAFDFEYDGCELCRRTRIMLGEYECLEVHHKDVDYENDVRENVLLLCTFCHKLVHLNHAFLYLHFLEKPRKGTADYY